jgi:purine-binding chemotaxis protein CheW
MPASMLQPDLSRTATRWVVFRCDDKRYGLPLPQVTAIAQPTSYTRLPGCGADVCGLIAVRGRVITVFDLGVILGGPAAAASADHRLLMLDLGDVRVGGAVDAVIEIASADLDEPEAGQPSTSELQVATVGRARSDDGDFTGLDLQRLLRHRLQG